MNTGETNLGRDETPENHIRTVQVIPSYIAGMGEAAVKVFVSDARNAENYRRGLDVERTRALLQDAIVKLCMGDMGGAVDAAGEALARMTLFSAPRGTT